MADDDHVEVGAVDTLGEVADEVYLRWVAEVDDDLFDDFVDAGVFSNEVVYVAEEWVFWVCFEDFAHSFVGTGEESCGFEAV